MFLSGPLPAPPSSASDRTSQFCSRWSEVADPDLEVPMVALARSVRRTALARAGCGSGHVLAVVPRRFFRKVHLDEHTLLNTPPVRVSTAFGSWDCPIGLRAAPGY